MGFPTIADRPIYHRKAVTAEDAASIAALAYKKVNFDALLDTRHDSQPNCILRLLRPADVECVFWGVGDENDTVIFVLVGRRSANAAPFILYAATLTLGSYTYTANTNPIDNSTVAATTFRAVDTIVEAVAGTSKNIYDSANNRIARVEVDTRGCSELYGYFVTFDASLTRIDAQITPIGV